MTATRAAPTRDPRAQLGRLLEDDPADLYENAPCGYLSTLPDGRIVKVNRTFCAWTGRSPERPARRPASRTCSPSAAGSSTRPTWCRCCACRARCGRSRWTSSASTARCCPACSTPSSCATTTARRCWCGRRCSRRRRGAGTSGSCWPPSGRRRSREARSRTVQQVVSDLAAATSVADVAAVDRASAAGRRVGAPGRGAGAASSPSRAAADAEPRLACAARARGCPTELLARAAGGGDRPARAGAGAGRAHGDRSTTGCGAERPEHRGGDGRRRADRAWSSCR